MAFIGDSIGADATTKSLLLGGIEGLTEEYYDSVNSRPWATGLDILRNQMLSRNIIIYELGTNNDANFSEQNIKEVMDIAGSSKTVIFITNYASNSNYPWFEAHNTIFHNAESSYNNVRVVNWAETAQQNGFMLDDPSVTGRSTSLGVHPHTQEERETFANLIIDAVNNGVCRSGPIELLGDTAEEMVWSGLLSAGFTKEQAAGIMGSMEGESGYNPAIHETRLHDQYWKDDGSFKLDENPNISYGLGLIQWSFTRRINLYNYIKDKAPDLLKYLDNPAEYGYRIRGDAFLQKAGDDGKELLSYELAFLYDEISNSSRYRGIMSQTTVEDAAEFFVRKVEVPGDMEGAVKRRKEWAREKYDKYKDRSDLIPSNYNSNVSVASGVVLADMQLGGTNKDYNGDPVFNDDQLAKIEEYRPFYEKAVEGTPIPWEMLAVIHTRESGLSRINPNADGLFQFAGSALFNPGAYVDDDEFVLQLQMMVETHLLPKWKDGLNEEDQIKQVFFGYNGRAKAYINQARDLGFTEEQAQLGEGSPYVMNKADAKRDPNKAPLGTWGQIKKDYGPIEYPANQDHGAYVMFVALHGGSLGGGGCAGDGANATGAAAINKKAVEFAWPLGDPHNSSSGSGADYLVATDAYKNAAMEMNNWYSNGGADCSYFVGTVVAAAGVDPDFPKAGSAVQTEYLRKSDKWVSVPNDGSDESVLKAGDIMIVPHVGETCGHVRVVVDLGNGTLGTAEASLDDHSGELHSYIGLSAGSSRGLYEIYRLK